MDFNFSEISKNIIKALSNKQDNDEAKNISQNNKGNEEISIFEDTDAMAMYGISLYKDGDTQPQIKDNEMPDPLAMYGITLNNDNDTQRIEETTPDILAMYGITTITNEEIEEQKGNNIITIYRNILKSIIEKLK